MPHGQNIKQKQHGNKFNKHFKNGPHQKNLKKKKITELIHTELSLVHIFNEFMFNFMSILQEWNRFDFNLKLNWGKKTNRR